MQVGDVLGALVGINVLGLKQLGKYILEAEAEEEPEVLVEGGVAYKMMAAALHALARETSQDEMARLWEQSSLQFDAFFPEVCNLYCYFRVSATIAAPCLGSTVSTK